MAIVVSISHRQSTSNAQPLVQPNIERSKKLELVGTPSCSASVCHGGSDLGQPRSEATTWRALDPHARAYDTLLSAQSKAIAKHLWGDTIQAHDASLCLKCHVHPEYEHARPNFRRGDGVGCESCHGAAHDWLTPHYRAANQKKLGMADTKSLPGRASICVTCHVGTPDANVDHDLIAAGHPPLRFEFATYFANLPPHWDVEKDRKANKPKNIVVDFEFQTWGVGQDISAAAAAELRAYRADPKNGKPWPEFAELDCFSCHHDLHAKSRRQDEAYLQGRRPGQLFMNQWYDVMTWLTYPGIQEVTRAQRPTLDPVKDRAEIASLARKHAARYRETAKIRQMDAHHIARLKDVAENVSKTDVELAHADVSAQFYLALLASGRIYRNDELTARLRQGATFPPGYNSPHKK